MNRLAVLKRLRATFKGLLRSMKRIRAVELAVEAEYSKDEMKTPVHLCIGQEAVSVGVCAALRPADAAFGTYRGHAFYLAKGGDLKRMLAELGKWANFRVVVSDDRAELCNPQTIPGMDGQDGEDGILCGPTTGLYDPIGSAAAINSAGINASITTAALVGKTITVTKGIITGFA